MRSLLAELRPALHTLRKSAALTTIVVLTLALVVGLNTAIFSVVDAVLLRPLPVAAPERLVALCERDAGEIGDWCGASVPDVHDVAAHARTIAVAGVARSWPMVLRTAGGSEGISGGLATPEAFAALGVRPAQGRLIQPADLGDGWARVVVLSDGAWRGRFGGGDVLGRSIVLDDEPHVVVGVLPPDARVPQLEDVEMWRPIHFDPRDEERRDWRGFLAFARLRDGATLEQARQEVGAIGAALGREHMLPARRASRADPLAALRVD